MEDLEFALREQIARGARQAPVSPTEAVEAARESRRLRLLVALTDDEAVHAEWARRVEYEDLDRFGKAAFLRAETDAVDETIDEHLSGDSSAETIELLARCEIGWRHGAIEAAVDEEPPRRSAAMVLARSTPGRLRPRLMECEVVDQVVDLLRAGAVVGADELWDQFLIWHGRLEDLEEADDEMQRESMTALEGVGAALDPALYGRGLLAGDYGAEWLDNPRAVADLLQIFGPSDWLEVVGTLELAADEAFELAATLAVSAALGIGEQPPGEAEAELLLELLAEEPKPNQKESPWESLAARLGCGFQVALGGEEFGLLLAQAAAHERLVTHGIHSPGIRGLPLSTTAPDHLDRDAIEDVVDAIAESHGDSAEMRVAAVRTLYDGAVWARRGGEGIEEIAESVAEHFETVDGEGLELARAHLLSELEPAHRRWEREQFDKEPTLQEAMVLAAAGEDEREEKVVDVLCEAVRDEESTIGLDCARRIGTLATDRAIEALGNLWLADAPVYRAPYLRGVLEEAISVQFAESEAGASTAESAAR